jgi:hypothetical protein
MLEGTVSLKVHGSRKDWHTGCQWFNENLMIQQTPLKTTGQNHIQSSINERNGTLMEASKITYHPAII